jgi:hypothetical protein
MLSHVPLLQVATTDVSGVKRRDLREKIFHIDDPNPAQVRVTTIS